MLGKCAKVILLWTAFFAVLWLCYGMVGTPTNVMAYIFCSAMSVATFVPAMYETILLVGFMMLQNIPVEDEYLQWDDASLNDDLWDVKIGTKDGMFFHLYEEWDGLFVGELCERVQQGKAKCTMDRQHFKTQRLCVDWFIKTASELESWDSTNPMI